jgi:hypothetical protein
MAEREPLRGRVCFEGAGQPAAQVLAVDERSGVVLTDAPTDGEGRFELTVPAGEGPLLLFARCRGPVAGVTLTRLPARDAEEVLLALDRQGGAWPLTIALAPDAPRPTTEPTVSLTPLAVAGIAPEEMRWSLARVGEVADSALETVSMSGGQLTRTVQAGRWWLRAELLSAYEAMPDEAGPVSSWVNDGAWLADGTPLEPSHGGFEVDVAGPTSVCVRLAAQRPSA